MFAKTASASENSLTGSGRSLSVENNYGYQDPFGPHTGAITRPGFARMDIKKHINGCGLVWTNHTESAPSMGTKALHDNLAWTARSGFRIWREPATRPWLDVAAAALISSAAQLPFRTVA